MQTSSSEQNPSRGLLSKSSFFAQISGFFLTTISLLNIVFKRLRHNLGLAASTILGIVAVMSIIVCVPVFSHAISSEVLRRELTEMANKTGRGLFSLRMYYLDKVSAPPITPDSSQAISNYIINNSPRLLGLPVDEIVMELESGSIDMLPIKVQGDFPSNEPWVNMKFWSSELLPDYAEIVEGEWPKPDLVGEGPIPVAVIESSADKYYLNVGDIYRDVDSNIEVEIAGIWRPVETNIPIWFENPNLTHANHLWVPINTYDARLGALMRRPIFYVSWYIVMDESSLRFQHAPQYARGLIRLDADLQHLLPGMITDHTPLEALKAYQQRAEALTTLFYAVGAPMIVLALLFIGLAASISVQQYEQETATMRGRGTSWMQVVALNLVESGLLILLAVPIALLVGWGAAAVMGKTLSFLQFTNRSDLPLSLEGINLLWIGIGALFIILARFFPMLEISRTTIVRVKQEQSRGARKPIWRRFYLDFLLLLPGIYAYLTLSGLAKPAKFLSQLQVEAGDQYRDPLLFIAPALFAMALCMVTLRVLPLILRLLAAIVDRLPGVWSYLSLHQIARRPQDHANALLLIMISLSLSIFSASTAKTLDKWLHDSIYYKSGADLVIHEYVIEGGGQGGFPGSSSSSTTVSELDLNVNSYLSLEDHVNLPSVDNATRVGRYEGTFSYGAGEFPVTILGIDRLDFPKTAFYRDDFASQSQGALMNALGAEPMGVLVPRDLAEESGLRLGDQLLMSVRVLDQSYERDLVIVGTYDYFPTVYPQRKPTMIVNLETVFENPDAIVGYDVWLDTRAETDTKMLIYQISKMIGLDRAVIKIIGNAYDEVKTSMDQPERVGLFGILNVGFLITGLMPGIGFVLYSYASLQRRFIQLGILRAIGLSVRQLIGYLVSEQFILMGFAILCGALIGLVTSYLFVPFLQVGAAPGSPVPPFEVLIGWGEAALLSLAFGIVLFLTILATIFYLAKLEVFKAVKMGESL